MPGPARPRRHWGRRLLITLLVLVVLAVAADRIGVVIAERTAGTALQSSQHLDSRPDVTIAGFPFLSQLAAGDYDQVTVTAHDVPLGNSDVRLDVSRLVVVLHSLHVDRSFSRFRAESADASGTVSYADLGRALGVTLRYRGDGRIEASKSVTVLGRTFTAEVSATPRFVDGALSFGRISVNGADRLAQEVVSALDDVFGARIPLSSVPFGVRVRSVRATSDGLTASLTGKNLTYDR